MFSVVGQCQLCYSEPPYDKYKAKRNRSLLLYFTTLIQQTAISDLPAEVTRTVFDYAVFITVSCEESYPCHIPVLQPPLPPRLGEAPQHPFPSQQLLRKDPDLFESF